MADGDRATRAGDRPPELSRRRFLSAVPEAAAVALAASNRPAVASRGRRVRAVADGVDPDVTVEPGGSATTEVTVDVGEELPVPTVDVLFCFDLTTSMEDEIGVVKDRAREIARELEDRELRPAFGVAGIKDYQGRYASYGYEAVYAEDTDYAWRVHQRITDDVDAVESALSSLSPGNGPEDDGAENYTRALYEFEHGDVGWRSNALRTAVLFGDNVPHDDDFHEEADEWGTYVDGSTGGDPGRDGELFTGDDLDFQAVVEGLSIPVVCVDSGEFSAAFRYVADRTGGAYVPLQRADEIPETVVDLVGSEAEQVTLSLRAEPGVADWVRFDPARHDGVEAGESRTFEMSLRPPEHAAVGIRPVRLDVVADGSVVGERERVVNVFGPTARPIAASGATGSGDAWPERRRVYEWFERVLASDYWADKQTRALRRFAEGLDDSVEDVVAELPRAVVAELAGAGYYDDLLTLSKATVSLATTVKAAQVADVVRRGTAKMPPGKQLSRPDSVRRVRELLEAGERGAALEAIGVVDVEYSGSGRDRLVERCGPSAYPDHTSLLEHLCHLRTTVADLENPYESGIAWNFRPKEASERLTLDPDNLSEGRTESVTVTAPPRVYGVTWTTNTYGGLGFLPDFGDYSYAVTLPRPPAFGPQSRSFDSDGHVVSLKRSDWSDTGYTEETVVSAGDDVEFTVEVESEPIVSPLPWLTVDDLDRVVVEVSLLYDYEFERTATGSETARSAWLDSRQVVLNQLDAAIAFFAAERDLLRTGDLAGVSVASPVDVHVEDGEGRLGAVYEGGRVSGVETSLGTDFLYDGPGSAHEGVALFDADGEYAVTVGGRADGTYDLTVFTARLRRGGVTEVETLAERSDVPVGAGERQTFSLTVDRRDGAQSVSVDTDSLGRASPLDGVPVVPLERVPTWLPSVGVGAAVAVGIAAWLSRLTDAGDDGR
jgi:hypothetical protein